MVYVVPALDIRLAGSANAMEGRVEVNYNNGGWGTIRDDLWSIEDADVACRMLGFNSASSFTKKASFGAGTGIIWLDNVQCDGDEESLLFCSHLGLAKHNCQHSEDSGVVCSSKSSIFFPPFSVPHIHSLAYLLHHIH